MRIIKNPPFEGGAGQSVSEDGRGMSSSGSEHPSRINADSPQGENSYQHLEVLPNIDINIKQGNSLVSRFDLDADLSQILANNDDLTIEEYKQAVRSYKETGDRGDKRALKEQINSIKESFSVGLKELHPVRQKLKKQREILVKEEAKLDLFEGEKKSKKEQKKITKTKKKIAELEEELAELENATFYDQAFEWRFEFPEVLDEDGNFTGFDAVIGNPPYVRHKHFKEIKEYLSEKFEVYYGSADLYSYFIEKGIKLLKPNGTFHFIVANKWMRTNYGKPLREWLQENTSIKSLYDFGDLPVFQEATTYPCLLQIHKTRKDITFSACEIEHLNFDSLQDYLNVNSFIVNQNKLQVDGWTLIDEKAQNLLEKLKKIGISLEDYVGDKINRGIVTGLNKAFVISEEKKKELIQKDSKSSEIIKPFLRGREVKRYQQPDAEEYVIFTRRGIQIEKYPAILAYLKKFKTQLIPRPKNVPSSQWKGRKPGNYEWYEIQDTIDYFEEFEKPKIIYPNICIRPEFTFDDTQQYTNQKCFIISLPDKALLGLLNSKIMSFFFETVLPKLRGDYFEPSFIYMKDFPVSLEKSKEYKSLTSLVDQILTAKEKDPEADTTELEEEIDRLVYELYGLSKEEIAIVEESVGN